MDTERPYAVASHPISDDITEAWRHEAHEKWAQDLIQTMLKMKARGILNK